jgi:hypothetical protein
MTYCKRAPAFMGRYSSDWQARPQLNLPIGGFSAVRHLRKAGQTRSRNCMECRAFAQALCMGS